MGKLIFFGLLIVAVAASSASGYKIRSKRQSVSIRQRYPELVSTPDRSVYARRNFAQPDVVSDVYEVYVGPSNLTQVKRDAVVMFQSDKGVQGVLMFTQSRADQPVFLSGTLSGLSPGSHGFHIHQKGDLRDGCKAAAGHFNPYSQTHGSPSDRNRHIGDLGNIQADASGIAQVMIVDPLISLSGVNSIIGRSVVVHEKEDDLGQGGVEESKKTGNAGGRVACGIIGVLQ